MRRSLLLAVSLTALSPALVRAQTGSAPPPAVAGGAAATALSEVVVVAGRSPQRLDTVGQSVSVVKLEDIRADQELVVSDILARLPGVSFSRNGGPGATTSLRIRGAEADQTVTLIDGVKLNDPSSPGGGYNFADLVTADIARIEVLRGPQSTLYGSQAIGGVVNIVTAEATAPLQGDAQIEGGGYGTGYAKAGLGGRADKLTWRLSGAYFTTDGVSAFDERLGGRERDGYRNGSASGRVTYQLLPNLGLDVRGFYANSRNRFDGFAPGLTDTADFGRTEQYVAYAALNLALLDGRLRNRFAVQATRIDRENLNPAQANTPTTFDSRGDNTRLEYQGTFALAPGYTAVFGAEHEESGFRTASPTAAAPNPRPVSADVSIDSGYLQVQGEVVRGLNLTGGVRRDDHETFGGATTGQASAAWRLFDGNTILRASYGGGFKAPTLFQLYSNFGNTGLSPEKADGYDAGIEQRFLGGRVIASATWFNRDTSNLITFVSCFGVRTPRCLAQPGGYYDNIARAEADGWELGVAYRPIEGLDLSANSTFTDSRDASPGAATRGRELARRPKETANFTASYAWPFALKTSVAARYAGRSFDNAANTTRLKSYVLWDVRASYPLPRGLEVYGRIENLTDEKYQTTFRYGSLGRAAYAGLRASF